MAAGLAAPAAHAQGTAAPTLGPWLFASVALVVVAVLAWRGGRREGARDRTQAPGRDGGERMAGPMGPMEPNAPNAPNGPKVAFVPPVPDAPATPAPAGSTPAGAPLTSGAPSRAASAAPPADPARAAGDAAPSDAALAQGHIQALCAGAGTEVRLGWRAAGSAMPWRVAGAHPALPDGAALFDRLPAAVAFAAQNLAAGATTEVEGWVLARTLQGGDERLLLRRATPGSSATEDPAAFSYTVSHDLRAPVRVVEGFARILKEDYGRQLDRIGNDHLDRVLAAAARMNAMIDAMLSLARLSSQPLARQPVNLSQLASFIVDDLQRAHPERQVAAQVQPGLQVVGDPTLLRQVLENLLGNAWKYTAQAEAAQIAFSANDQDGRRVYEVRDNGAGFDMRSSDRLFGLFQRLHSAKEFPGTGVGLASVQRIVRRHGGDVWAQAEPGKGARFYFTLG